MKTLNHYNQFDIINNKDKVMHDYQHNGIIYLKDFVSTESINLILNNLAVTERCAEEDIRKNWSNEKIYFYTKYSNESMPAKDFLLQPYFLQSHDKAHVFYELNADKAAINRIGHGMHLLNEFRSIQNLVYHYDYCEQLLKLNGFIKPICQLSVYIPKHADEIGSDVTPHQESTFAYTQPLSVTVLWVALEDAVIENACMWGILGSNKWPLQNIVHTDHINNKRKFVRVNTEHDFPELNTEKKLYTPLEVKKGDAIFFHGNFVHCSPVNKSNVSRKALSFQFIETHQTHYADVNWLQPRNNKFIYDLT